MLRVVRTTINLPDGLVEAAKARAAAEGRTFTSLVAEALRAVVDQTPEDATQRTLPAFGDPEGAPLVDLEDRDALEAALDADGFR